MRFVHALSRLVLCLTLLFGAASVIASPSDVFVSLRTTAEVRARAVQLGDIATVVSADASEQARWLALEIAHPSSLATPLRLSRDDVTRTIATQYPDLSSRLVWGGSKAVLISGQPQDVNMDKVIDSAATFLLERLGGKSLVTLRLIDVGERLKVPLGVIRNRVDVDAFKMTGPYAEVPVIVEVDGTPAARLVLCFAVTRSAIAANVAPNDRSAEIKHPQEASSKSGDSGGDFAVSKQKPVTILIDSEGVRIESEGVALDSARIGDTVRVRRLNGSAELEGRVVRQGVVAVEDN